MSRVVIAGALGAASLAAASLVVAPLQAQTRTGSGQNTVADGKALYQANCAACHDDKGFATRVLARRVPADQAVLDTRKNLNREFIHLIVRQGTGSMPQIRKSELPDVQLDAIVSYLEKGR